MYAKNIIIAAATFFFANQAFAAAIENVNTGLGDRSAGEVNVDLDARAALIATDPYSSCNCPNNCSHKSGSSCKYYSGPSDSSQVVSGHCAYSSGGLLCIAQS